MWVVTISPCKLRVRDTFYSRTCLSTLASAALPNTVVNFKFKDWAIGSGEYSVHNLGLLDLAPRPTNAKIQVPHGGVVTSTFLRVAESHFNGTLSSQNQPHTLALHLDFLRRTQIGEALFTVRDTKLGRQTSVIHVVLTQGASSDSREEVVGYITNG